MLLSMAPILYVLGVVSWIIAGISLVFALAPGGTSATSLANALIAFLSGVSCFAAATVLRKLEAIREEASNQRGWMFEQLKAMRAALERMSPPPPKAEPQKTETVAAGR